MRLRSQSKGSSVSPGLVFLAGASLLLLLSTCLYTGWGAWALLGGGIGLASGGLGLLSRCEDGGATVPNRTEKRLRHLEAIVTQSDVPEGSSAPKGSPSAPAH